MRSATFYSEQTRIRLVAMKSRWDMNDYTRMARHPLPFTDLDIQGIYWGLDGRADRFAGAARDERAADGSRPLPPRTASP